MIALKKKVSKEISDEENVKKPLVIKNKNNGMIMIQTLKQDSVIS